MKCGNAQCPGREASVGVLIQYAWGRVPPIPMCAECSQGMPAHYLIVALPTHEELSAPTIMYDQETTEREKDRLMPHWAAQAGIPMSALRPSRAPMVLVWVGLGIMALGIIMMLAR